ncbi:hypothetical protein E3A20_08860 [Planctomyces bekefii]|uniref:Uncharacterized protein n=1 Tax=Planctomyces bekefii TaxID=1653850 RepID=A0A5C6MAQ3_9PLAN|nr:hypothetical protein E3A20_08860 [Planctomyces bekefii]
MIASTLLVAAALIPKDLPETTRVQRLSPFFSPKPGNVLNVDADELRNLRTKIRPEALRGVIRVSPPKGTCFIITRMASQPDDRICKPKNLTFSLRDLNRAGQISWVIKTGDGDFGTTLVWPTPYRIAIVTPFNNSPEDPPKYHFILSCKATKTEETRKIALEIDNGQTWTIRFPKVDTLEPQPKPLPNLYIVASGGKVSVKDAAEKKRAEEAAREAEAAGAPAPDAAPAPGASGDGKDGDGKDGEKSDKKPEEVDQSEDRVVWAIPARNSYGMNGSAFMPYGSVAGGSVGLCRYNYEGSTEDRWTGRVECHDVDGFRDVVLPVTCLRDIRP